MFAKILPLALVVLSAVWAEGRVFSPRVLSPHHADTYSMKAFARFHRWRDLEGDAKVFAIFQYLTGTRTGIYPMGVPAREGQEQLTEFSAVRDPVKMLNVYTIGHCGTLGPTAAGIMESMGIGPARTLIIPAWHHVAAEVYYAKAWHYLDLDVRAVFRRENGVLASMAEAQRDASLWDQSNQPWFFPLDPIPSVREVYAKTAVHHYYGFFTGGHTMDYVLRQGESFTRWWTPQGGRWNHHPSYGEAPFPRDVLLREPRGPKCKHASFTTHAHGNGLFLYQPNLTSASSDFEDGVYDSRNVRPGPDGLTLAQPGEGFAVFEVRSPYVIVPQVGDLDTTADDREASVVTFDAKQATLSVSRDHGFTWNPLTPETGRIDLTAEVSGTYGYWLKFELRGSPGEALLRNFEIATWVQVHPASLPSLRQGKNRMQLLAGDDYDLPASVVEIRPNTGNRNDLLKYLSEAPDDYDPARATERIRGSLTVKVPAPPGAKVAWFSAGGSFRTHQGPSARNTRNRMAYALKAGEAFKEFYSAEVPTDQGHWHYNVDREIRLEEPSETVFVRYHGDPALNAIRIYAHCLEARSEVLSPVQIKHVWTEGGERRTKELRLEGPGFYEIEAVNEPLDESITLSVPSVVETGG